MGTKKVIIYTVSGIALIILAKKLMDTSKYQNFSKRVTTLPKKNEFVDIPLKDENKQVQDIIEERPISVRHEDSNEYVFLLKEIINHFYGQPVLKNTDDYDFELLEEVQDIFGMNSPALMSYEHGEVSTCFIDAMDYIIAKSKGIDVSGFTFDEIPDLYTCEVVKKGDKGQRVMELQRFVNAITNDDTLEVNGKYSGKMREIVRDVFGNSNVIRQDASSGVCYRFLKSATNMIKNIDENINEDEEQSKSNKNV